MPDQQIGPIYKIGDKVRIKFPTRMEGVVTEVHYVPQGSGRISYRVRVPMEPEPLWWEIREGELEKL
jgi:hypothetical protein